MQTKARMHHISAECC